MTRQQLTITAWILFVIAVVSLIIMVILMIFQSIWCLLAMLIFALSYGIGSFIVKYYNL